MNLIIAIIMLSSLIFLELILSPNFLPYNFKETFWVFPIFFSIISFALSFMSLIEDTGQPNIPIDQATELKFQQWLAYLNEVVSLFCLGGALSSISTKAPSKYAALFFVTILLYTLYKMYENDKEFFKLQFKINKSCSEAELYALKINTIKQELKVKNIFPKVFFYVAGISILISVMLFEKQYIYIATVIENI